VGGTVWEAQTGEKLLDLNPGHGDPVPVSFGQDFYRFSMGRARGYYALQPNDKRSECRLTEASRLGWSD